MVFYLDITDLKYYSQNTEFPMGAKQPSPTVIANVQIES